MCIGHFLAFVGQWILPIFQKRMYPCCRYLSTRALIGHLRTCGFEAEVECSNGRSPHRSINLGRCEELCKLVQLAITSWFASRSKSIGVLIKNLERTLESPCQAASDCTLTNQLYWTKWQISTLAKHYFPQKSFAFDSNNLNLYSLEMNKG